MRLTVSLLILLSATAGLKADSLWNSPSNPQRGMVADRRAARVGDILTIVIAENVASSNTQAKKTSKSSEIDASISSFLFPSAASGMGKHNGSLPATNLSASNTFDGSGSTTNAQSLNSRAAVLVADVLPNGNLVIEGVRTVTFSGETQYVVLHGLVRADDVTSSNTVLSSNIADARLEFISEGSLTDAQKKGWLTKIYDKLRPY